MSEIERLKKELKDSALSELQQERLIEYFKPIYIVEFEIPVEGELFPRLWRWPLYDKRTNYKEAMKYWDTDDQVKRIIEKSMYSGRERILKERN